MKKFILILTMLFSITVNAQTAGGTNQQGQASNHDSTSIDSSGATLTPMAGSGGQNANNAQVAPMYCQSRTVSWVAFGITCTGTASMTNENATRTVVSSGTNTGSATYTCSNNTFINPTNATCAAPPPPRDPNTASVPCAGYLVNYGTVCMQPTAGQCGMGPCFSPYYSGTNQPVVSCGMSGCR